MSALLLLISMGVLLFGAALCVLLAARGDWANRAGGIVAVAGALPALAAGGYVLWTGQAAELRLPWAVPFGSFFIAVDALSAFFVLAIAVICGLAAVYGVAYLKSDQGPKDLGVRAPAGIPAGTLSWFFYNILFASMLLVVTARNGVLFLVAWELMSLASFFLVMSDHERAEVREAGWTYLVATHLGTAFLLAMFVLLSAGGQSAPADILAGAISMDFDQFAVPAGPSAASGLFLLAVIGFGTKAGFLPMHVWLPEAHPAAPSHVSAVMSGVMIKTGIYGLVRTLSFLGPPEHWPSWWGWTLIGIGAASGIGGVLFALAQHDLKRLLAYHSVENIGIISLGLGLWVFGSSTGHAALALLGLLGGLLHVWNHAVFKSLLFLGAGAVAHATGTRDIEQLGGLLKRMKLTGAAFLIGSAAICGLPPLNGFVSEFLIYAGAFSGIAHTGRLEAVVAGLVVVAALALIGGLAIACFAKVCGIVFLGEPRSGAAEHAHDPSLLMRVPQAVLAGLCVAIGFLGPVVVGRLGILAAGRLPSGVSALGVMTGPGVSGALWRVSAAFVVLMAMILSLWLVRRRLLSRRTVAQAGTWGCGYAAPTARMQYTASSFAWPILGMFRLFVRPQVHRRLPLGLFPAQASLESHTEDLFRRHGYEPVFRAVVWLAQRLRWVQLGRNQVYVLYVALALLILLVWKLGVAR